MNNRIGALEEFERVFGAGQAYRYPRAQSASKTPVAQELSCRQTKTASTQGVVQRVVRCNQPEVDMGSGASRLPESGGALLGEAVYNQGGWMTQSYRQRQMSRRSKIGDTLASSSKVQDKVPPSHASNTISNKITASARHLGPFYRSGDTLPLRDAIQNALIESQRPTPSIARMCYGSIASFYTAAQEPENSAKTHLVGEGSSCRVYEGIRIRDHRHFAIKQLNQKASRKVLLNELKILRQLDHPNVIQHYDTFLDDIDMTVYFVLEFCEGGDLFDNLKRRGHFTEPAAARMLVKMFHAVQHLHSLQIAHRDLKLENWVMRRNNGDDLDPVLIDFGLSYQLKDPAERMYECLGTSFYVAPETVRKNYGLTCDVWALGVITYMVLSGKTPFGGKDDQEVLHRILHCNVTFISPVWTTVSSMAKDFICSLLRKNPGERLSLEQALEHPWMVQNAGKKVAASSNMGSAVYKAAQVLLNQMSSFLALPLLVRTTLILWASDGPLRSNEMICQNFELLSENCAGGVPSTVQDVLVDGRDKRAFSEMFDKLCDLSESRLSFQVYSAMFLKPEDLPNYNGCGETMNRIFESLAVGGEFITAMSLRACLGAIDSSPRAKSMANRTRKSSSSAVFVAMLEEVFDSAKGKVSRSMFSALLLGKKVQVTVSDPMEYEHGQVAHISVNESDGDDDDDMIDSSMDHHNSISSDHPEMPSQSASRVY